MPTSFRSRITSASNALFPRRNGSNPPLSRPSGTLCPSDGERLGEKFPRKISRIEPLKRSSRREEALIDFGFRISDFGFGVNSLLKSAAARFMRRAGADRAPRHERIDGKRRDPGREIGVDGPTAVLARRGEQKLNSLFRHGMIHLSAARQTHHHETGERCGFEETAARRLNVRQHFQRSLAREISGEPSEWIS